VPIPADNNEGLEMHFSEGSVLHRSHQFYPQANNWCVCHDFFEWSRGTLKLL